MEPKIRLKGFEGEWAEKKLTDVVSLYNGLTYSPNDIRKRGTLVLRSSNVQNGEISLLDNVFVNPSVVNCEKVKFGDIIVVVRNGSRALIGKHAMIKQEMKDTVIGAFMAGVRSKNPEFLNALLGSPRFYYEVEKNLGATINQITNSTFNSMYFGFPLDIEQKEIGEFFSNFDSQITSSASRLASLKQIKTASLQSMFPQEGESVPKVRFKGFDGEWKKVRLGDITKGFMYGINAAAVPYDGSNKYLRITDIDDSTHIFLQDSLTTPGTNLSYCDEYIMQEGDIVVARTGASVGKSYIYHESDGKVYFAGFLIRIRLEDIVNHDFVFQNTLSYQYSKYIKLVSMRSGQPGVNVDELKSYKLCIPSFEEQQKIADYFTNLDKQISLQSQRLEKLKQIKAACLDMMFV